jgi:hypothetical protein
MRSLLASVEVEPDDSEDVEGRDENGERFPDEKNVAMMGL